MLVNSAKISFAFPALILYANDRLEILKFINNKSVSVVINNIYMRLMKDLYTAIEIKTLKKELQINCNSSYKS
jgi:hypothetical protein